MKKNNYMSVWVFCMILMLSVSVFSYIRTTYADFNGVTGDIDGIPCKVSYSSNYPDDLEMQEKTHIFTGFVNSNYFIEEDLFPVPNGYVFYSWNTALDGSGKLYKAGKFHKLEEDINLYAIWGKYILGDVNLDGIVTEDDVLYVNKYIVDTSFLIGVVARNADVNLDEKVDLVDADIIRQAYLGTDGYSSLLSNEPVFIYEIYKPNNNGTGNSGNNNGTGNSGNNGGIGNNSGGTSSDNNDFDNNDYFDEEVNDNKENNENKDNSKDNTYNNTDQKTKRFSASYIWVLVIGICVVSLRIIIDLIRKIIKIKNK